VRKWGGSTISPQSADKDQQEMHAVAEELHDAVVKFDKYRNLQRHRAVLLAIAWRLGNLVTEIGLLVCLFTVRRTQ